MTSFQDWIDRAGSGAGTRLLPLTHLSQALTAKKIIDDGRITAEECKNFGVPLAYFFYGRPAYRVNADAVVQIEASCPMCFVFSPALLARASRIFAFDTGAFYARMYGHILDEQFEAKDFELADDPQQINRLIKASFENLDAYLLADRSQLRDANLTAEPWEMVGKAYLTLLGSPGRNEPDDRICTVEVTFNDPVLLDQNLDAVIVPHTFWNDDKKAPFLVDLESKGVDIRSYRFPPGRSPEYFQAMIEGEMMRFLRQSDYLK